ncbi:MAG: amino acid adenylation domain-containing protein, partial [bacterium]|nr:amino acid adenylation domain-containing protein [bacterium]
PNKGIGYGILKYITDEKENNEPPYNIKPQMVFNYLGQFGNGNEKMTTYEIARESVGNLGSLKGQREYELEISGLIANKQLSLTLRYNKKQYKKETLENFANHYKTELSRIIDYCTRREERELTPSDLIYKKLTLETLEDISKQYPVEDIYTLSPMQEGMLFHTMLEDTGSEPAYIEQMSYRLRADLQMENVRESLNQLLKRNAILRTAFHEGEDRPIQIVLQERQVDFRYDDIRERIPAKEQEAYITEFKIKERNRTFDLSKDVLIRVNVIQIDDKTYDFTWTHHHILMDGWCLGILITEFFEYYNSNLQKRPPNLPPVSPYRNYIEWLEELDGEAAGKYWEEYLSYYEEAVEIPGRVGGRRTPNSERKRSIDHIRFQLTEENTLHLSRLAAQNKVTLNTLLQTLWGIVLGKYNRTEDTVFGAVVSGRPSEIESIESMVGLFINTIPVRIRCEKKLKLKELIRKIQEEAVESDPHHYYPLARIQAHTHLKQELLDHILVFENYPVAEQIEGVGGSGDSRDHRDLKVEISNVEAFSRTNYDFNMVIFPGDQLAFLVEYDDSIFDKKMIDKLLRHFENLMLQTVAQPGIFIYQYEYLSEEEKQWILTEFNKLEDAPPAKTIHELFEEQEKRNPNQMALTGASAAALPQGMQEKAKKENLAYHLTYGELNRKANRLARKLIEKGIKPDMPVAIKTGRIVEMITGILGILKAGAAYLPIDPDFPEKRIDFILKDSAARIMITAGEEAVEKRQVEETINLQEESREIGKHTHQPFHTNNCSTHNLAYIIYTSGTTGRPKGTMVEHRNAAAYLYAFSREFQFSTKDILVQLASYAFDAFVEEVFGLLTAGGKIVIPRREDILEIHRLTAIINKFKATVIDCSPLLLNQLNQQEEILESAVHTFISGGDILKGEYIGNLLKTGSVYNTYGPTETTVCALYYRCSHQPPANVPIGKPIENYTVYILDENQNLQPTGIPGELCIAGPGVVRGYLNRIELNREKFITSPYVKEKDTRLYKTGDLARLKTDGNIEFLGRIDQQVKIRGFRIELAEIENQLLKHERIEEAVVQATEIDGEQTLTAYLVSGDRPSLSEIREYLAKRLPTYMIPQQFMNIEKIPVTPQGKIDKHALEAYGTAVRTDTRYAAPKSDTEEITTAIWKEVLKQDKIGTRDDFFQLGGDSLKAIMLVTKIHKKLNVKVPVGEIFKKPTIKELVGYILDASKEIFIPIERTEEREYYKLSHSQKRLWVSSQLETDPSKFNIPSTNIIEGAINREAFDRAFEALVERHESLRTIFQIIENEPVQKILSVEKSGFKVKHVDLRESGDGEQKARERI